MKPLIGTTIRAMAIACAIALVGTALAFTAPPPARAATAGTTYYVDSQLGSDSNQGTSSSAPWKSLAKVNATTFRAGDRILLADGSEWSGTTLWPKGSGDATANVTIGDYGSGAQPRVDGAGQVANAVELFNQQYWTIENIEVTNDNPSAGADGTNLGDFRGIFVGGDDGQRLSGFTIDGVYVHDVTGEVDWMGGSTSGNKPGITFDTGWDGMKNTGGIVFETTVPDKTAPGQPTILNDMTVENSKIENTSFGGIVTKQYAGTDAGAVATGWGTRAAADDPNYAPFTDLTVENNYITQNGTEYGANGMLLNSVRGAVVRDNLVDRTGTSGIEYDYSDNVVTEHNEVMGTTVKAGGGDSNAIDPDMGTTNMTVQYNYLHNNDVGFLDYQIHFGSSIWRYNVVANNSKYPMQLGSASSATAQIYDNTFYNTATSMAWLMTASNYAFTDNAFYSTQPAVAMPTASSITYQNNYYGGPSATVPAVDSSPVTGDARFTNPDVTGPYGTAASGPALTTGDAYTPLAGSALIDTGAEVTDDGGTDYAGDQLYNGAPDIGAFEYSTKPGATTEAIDGTITSASGSPLSGVAVSVSATGTTFATTTDGNGYYVVPNVPFTSGATVTASKTGYKTVSSTVNVANGDSARLDISLTSTATTGALEGAVDDDHAKPLDGARVTLSKGTAAVATTTTDGDGDYSFPTVGPGDDYTLTASLSGYRDASVAPGSIEIAETTTAPTLLMATTSGTVLQTHDFTSIPDGPLAAGTDDWTTSTSGGGVNVITDAPGANHSLQVTRTTNSGSTNADLDFATPLKGLVTVEADVQRTDDPTANKADYFSAPYIYGTSSTPSVAVATTKGSIQAYEGTSLATLGAYATGSWYHLALVIDTVNQTYDLYVDGAKLVADAAFRTSMTGISRISYYANSSNYGTELVDNVRVGYGVIVQQSSQPAQASLSTTQGWETGLADGYYTVQLNNWWGSNATKYSLYRDGTLIYSEPLLANGDEPQTAFVAIDGQPNGHYVYTGVLSNSSGQTATTGVTVDVSDANPGTPVVSDDGYAEASTTTVTTNMWWGTNATGYQLYVDGVLADQQTLTAGTPAAQKVTTTLADLAPGQHQIVAVLTNSFGSTSSQPLTLKVSG